MHLSVTSKFRHKVRSLFREARRWLFNCITLYRQRGRPLRGSGPNSEENAGCPKTAGCSWDVLQSTSGQQRHSGVRDDGNIRPLMLILLLHKKKKKKKSASKCHIPDSMSDEVPIRCSDVAHGVCWVCQTGMESEVHGLRIRHDCRRLLFLSPPQTCRLRVQVPLCGIRQTIGYYFTK